MSMSDLRRSSPLSNMRQTSPTATQQSQSSTTPYSPKRSTSTRQFRPKQSPNMSNGNSNVQFDNSSNFNQSATKANNNHISGYGGGMNRTYSHASSSSSSVDQFSTHQTPVGTGINDTNKSGQSQSGFSSTKRQSSGSGYGSAHSHRPNSSSAHSNQGNRSSFSSSPGLMNIHKTQTNAIRSKSLVLYGGSTTIHTKIIDSQTGRKFSFKNSDILGDIWVFSLFDETWRHITCYLKDKEVGMTLCGHCATSHREHMIVIGGLHPTHLPAETWELKFEGELVRVMKGRGDKWAGPQFHDHVHDVVDCDAVHGASTTAVGAIGGGKTKGVEGAVGDYGFVSGVTQGNIDGDNCDDDDVDDELEFLTGNHCHGGFGCGCPDILIPLGQSGNVEHDEADNQLISRLRKTIIDYFRRAEIEPVAVDPNYRMKGEGFKVVAPFAEEIIAYDEELLDNTFFFNLKTQQWRQMDIYLINKLKAHFNEGEEGGNVGKIARVCSTLVQLDSKMLILGGEFIQLSRNLKYNLDIPQMLYVGGHCELLSSLLKL
ncbi:unnamed protein product [Ambrosiozyma monospora]|uniref:Unnamed protein product n=1 Tax=Ambrosiozyma monospora TaxID=43982 RepID=A0ACB5T9D2_AMBMO|nr:unnamed protein product [Ambrosiozyma monospora]